MGRKMSAARAHGKRLQDRTARDDLAYGPVVSRGEREQAYERMSTSSRQQLGKREKPES